MTGRIIFYISGHGLGHAIRSLEVVKALKKINPSLRIFVRTSAPEWVFNLVLNREDRYEQVSIDVGAVQRTSLWIDKDETFQQWLKIEKKWDEIFSREMNFIRKEKINLIFGDIPPLAFRIAQKAGLPSIAMGNFGWDWIYESWIPGKPEFREIAKTISDDYSKASLLLRLPMHEPMKAFQNVEDIPIVARKAKKDRIEVRKEIGISNRDKLILLALPEWDRELIPWDSLEKMDNIFFLSPFPESQNQRVFTFPKEGVTFPDLVTGSDLVLSKPGYGIVAECYANRTPLLYVLRDDFPECNILVQWIQDNMPSMLLPREDFLSGNWENHIEQFFAQTHTWNFFPINGGEIAANRLIQFLE